MNNKKAFGIIARSMALDEETAEPVETKITGTVPSWLSGTLFRNGAGIFEIGDIKMKHLFDGFAVLSRYDIKDGKVFFKNRILKSDTWTESIKANRLVYSQFGMMAMPDPCKSIFSRFLSYFNMEMTDNTSVNVIKHGDGLFAMTETSKIIQVDPDTLDPVDKVDFTQLLAVHGATAHPHKDKHGVVYNLATNYKNRQMAYCITASEPNSDKNAKPFDNIRIVGGVPSRWKSCYSYNHSFGMSENYFVIFEQNVCMDLLRAAFAKLIGYAYVDCMKTFTDEEAQLSLLSKKDGQHVKTIYRYSNLFCFHHINSYEEDGHLIVDFCSHENPDVIGTVYIEAIRNQEVEGSKAYFTRLVIPLDLDENAPIGENLVTLKGSRASAVKREDGTIFLAPDYLVDDPSDENNRFQLELPTFNYEKHVGRSYRYCYGSSLHDQVNKVDIELRSMKSYTDPKGNSLGEPVFVESPDAKAEDEGVLLVPVISLDRESPCYLTILNAQTMEEIAKCDVPTSTVIPTSFHGIFAQKQ